MSDTDSRRRAFTLLRTAFVAVLLIAGVDKFFRLLVDWDVYISPAFSSVFGGAPRMTRASGVLEILVALLLVARPRAGAAAAAACLGVSVVNLLLIPGYYDVVLTDSALALAAMALFYLAA